MVPKIMDDLYKRLLADPHIAIGIHQGTVTLVNELPAILSSQLGERATVQSIMRAQHIVLQSLIERNPPPDWLIDLSESVAEWRNWDIFLECINWSENGFLQFAYLSEDEIARVSSGFMTIDTLLRIKPQAFIAPMLRKIKYILH